MNNKNKRKIEICFIRHANARPRHKTNTINDFVRDELHRELTKQSEKEIKSISNLGSFDIVISSPAKRAIDTAELVSGKKSDYIVSSLSTHLWNGDWKSVDNAFVNWYGPSRNTLRKVYSQISRKEKLACEDITKQAFDKIMEIILKEKNAKKFLIAGHDLHLQALALKFDRDNKWLTDLDLGEGKYFCLKLYV